VQKDFLTHTENKLGSSLYIVFIVLNKLFALPIEQISEIIQLPELEVLNNSPSYLAGLINLRGKVVTAIDPYPVLGGERSFFKQDNLILVTSFEGGSIGLIVDSIKDTVNFDLDNMEISSKPLEDSYIRFVSMWEGNLIYFLNLEAFLEKTELGKFVDNGAKSRIFESFVIDERSAEKFKKRAFGLRKIIETDVSIAGYSEKKYVLFSLGNEVYGINLKKVMEFCKDSLSSVVSVPCTPNFIIGVYNLRGEFITVVDIKPFLNIADRALPEKVKFIIIKSDYFKVAIIVDDILDIDEIAGERKLATPSENSAESSETNKYISSELILDAARTASILDIEKLLREENIVVEDAV
jgi:purine-binding chemotaxis protein CheW